jgi:cytochrome P450 family 135
MSGAALPPGPRIPAAAQILNWLFRPIAFMQGCRRRFGDTFSLVFPGFETPMVIVSDPEDVARLFKARDSGLPPGRSVALEPLLGSRSILLLEGREHLARRRLMLPPFHGERMRAYEGTITRVAREEIADWPLGEEFRLHPRMQALTLEVILRAVFGVSDPARMAALRPLLGRLLDDTASPMTQVRFLLSRRVGAIRDPLAELRRSLVEVDRIIALEAAERRADPALEEREDILSLLVAARFEEDGRPLDDDELRDQMMTLLVAGHETTATALAWTFDLLLRHPAVTERLRAELDAGSEQLLKATIAESLRLRPVIPLAGRRLHSPLELAGGQTLPAGSDVSPAIWLTHTRPETYPEPLRFRPERFLAEPPETYSWIPFGGGVRRCLGASFAEFEMRIVLREVLERCELAPARRHPERIARRNITFSPRHGAPVRLLRRRTPAGAPEPAPA